MPESSLPPPTKNSNGPLLIGGLLVLFVIGGFVVWKATSSKSDTAEVAPAVSLPAQSNEVQQPPPPPPPPAETESEATTSEPEVATAKTPAVAAGPKGTSPCAGTCSGSADSSLRAALRQKGGSAKGCYNKALRTNPTLQGKVTVAIRVSPSGTACSASAVSDSLGDPAVTSCILQNFRGGAYPKPKGGCVDVQVPLNFVPSGN